MVRVRVPPGRSLSRLFSGCRIIWPIRQHGVLKSVVSSPTTLTEKPLDDLSQSGAEPVEGMSRRRQRRKNAANQGTDGGVWRVRRAGATGGTGLVAGSHDRGVQLPLAPLA